MKKITFFTSLLLSICFVVIIMNIPTALADINARGTNPTPPPVTLVNPLGTVTTPQAFIGTLIKTLLGVVGSIALLMFIYGGFMWMTSMGDSKKVDTGKETMKWATFGMAIIFSAYAMVRFVIETVGAK